MLTASKSLKILIYEITLLGKKAVQQLKLLLRPGLHPNTSCFVKLCSTKGPKIQLGKGAHIHNYFLLLNRSLNLNRASFNIQLQQMIISVDYLIRQQQHHTAS